MKWVIRILFFPYWLMLIYGTLIEYTESDMRTFRQAWQKANDVMRSE